MLPPSPGTSASRTVWEVMNSYFSWRYDPPSASASDPAGTLMSSREARRSHSVDSPFALITGSRTSAVCSSANAAPVFRPNRLMRPLLRIGSRTEPRAQPAIHVSVDLLSDQLIAVV